MNSHLDDRQNKVTQTTRSRAERERKERARLAHSFSMLRRERNVLNLLRSHFFLFLLLACDIFSLLEYEKSQPKREKIMKCSATLLLQPSPSPSLLLITRCLHLPIQRFSLRLLDTTHFTGISLQICLCLVKGEFDRSGLK